MKRRPATCLGVIAGLLLFGSPILGHHGTNVSYDRTKPIALKGTVTEFVWSNPHCQLYFDVRDESGTVTKWAGELNSPSVLGRQGWTRRTFKPGDAIALTVFPSRAGAPVGVVDRTHAIFANGKEVVPAVERNVD